MADFSLEERFPDMKPIRSPPSLWTVYGFGTMAYGARDHDPETGTYVKTVYLTALFVPVLALGAYRVANALEGGWYFLGKVRISGPARLWNSVLLASVLVGVGLFFWIRHTSSPDYVAGQKLAEAARLAEAKQVGRAARLYAEVATGDSKHAREAADKLNALLDLPASAAPPEEAAEAVKAAVGLSARRLDQFPRLYERGVQLAEGYAGDRPRGALLVLDALAPVAPDPAQLAEKQAAVLEKLIAAEPDNLDNVVRLALAHEARKDLDRCEKLLAPLAGKLGDTEGARALGVIWLRKPGKLDDAERLLTAYTGPRLDKLKGVVRTLRDTQRALEERVIAELRSRKAEGFDYRRHQLAGKDEQHRMVDEYIFAKIKEDEGVRAARAAVLREQKVVAAALDLGLALLQRAQGGVTEGRHDLLLRAEKTFLAVREAAGPGDEVTLNLGEVYYWLGKQAEGKKLFTQLLRDRGEDGQVALRVAGALRRVGESSEARRLAEKVHALGKQPLDREIAADLRATLFTDLDDQIQWLKRANPKVPGTGARLSSALGQKAAQEGNDEEAIRHYREAARVYEGLPQEVSTLNNAALVHMQIFYVSGDKEEFLRASRLLDKALAREPGDSILVRNAASFALDAAAQDVAGEALDLKALRGLSPLQLLPYLYEDQAGRDRLAARLRKHPALDRAVGHLERVLLLAPRDAVAPSLLWVVHLTTQDLPALRRLEERVRTADLDLERARQQVLDNYRGKDLEKQRADHATRVAQARKTVKAARKVGGATQGAAAAELARELGRADGLELPLDADEPVRLAEEAVKVAPSQGTRSNLVSALLLRAGRALAVSNKEYGAWVKKTRRALGHNSLIALALADGGGPGAAALKNADVRRVLKLELAWGRAFPDEGHPWAWAVLHRSYPEEGARLVKAAGGDEAGRLGRALEARLSPLSAQGALLRHWALQMAGNEAEAREVLRRAAKAGSPLPFAVK
jgi:hypothetical protein